MLLKEPTHSSSWFSRQGPSCSAAPAGLSPRGHCLLHPASPQCSGPESLHLPLKQKLSSGPTSRGHAWCLRAGTPRLGWSQLDTLLLAPSRPVCGHWGVMSTWLLSSLPCILPGDQPCESHGEHGGGGIAVAWALSPPISGWCLQPHGFHLFPHAPTRGRRLRSGSGAEHGTEVTQAMLQAPERQLGRSASFKLCLFSAKRRESIHHLQLV